MKSLTGRLYLSGAFVLAGTSVVAARLLTGSLGLFTLTAISLLLALPALLLASWRVLPNSIRHLTRQGLGMAFLQALFGIFLFRLFLLQGLTLTSAGEAGLLTGATPALTAGMAVLMLKESANRTRLSGIASTILGVSLIQGLLLPESHLVKAHLYGNLWVLGAAACESLFNVLSRLGIVKSKQEPADNFDPLFQAAIVCLIAFLLSLVPALLEHPEEALASLTTGQWLALFWYGLIVTALGYIFWYAGIKRSDASVAAAFSGLMPFTALVLSISFLGEKASLHQWLGGTLVVIGMVLSSLKPAYKTIKPVQPAGSLSDHQV